MSPVFDVHLEIHNNRGVLDPVANTMNRSIPAILTSIFGDIEPKPSIGFTSVGKVIHFCIECASFDEAVAQVREMIPLPPISNPVLQRVIDLSVTEQSPFNL